MKKIILLSAVLAAWCFVLPCRAQRFPQPDFDTEYVVPSPTAPNARSDLYEYIDVALLFAALALASYLSLKRRRRREIFLLMVACLVYFGFWREGCVCPVGSLQNVALAYSHSGYAVPWNVSAFFLLPLVFAVFFGRAFCSGVCPLGGIQDLVVIRPVKLPAWLAQGLGVLPYVYLGLAVLFVTTGSGFIVCRYDPFVSFFRFSGNSSMLILGGVLLMLGVVVARPYCRFLCPYGVLLNWMSRFSWRHVTITPDDCVRCRLCEESCPFGSIRKPTLAGPLRQRGEGMRRLALLLGLLPVMVIGGGWAGSRLEAPLSMAHPTVNLAERIAWEDAGNVTEMTVESETFRSSGKPLTDLNNEALMIREQFARGLWVLGGFMGLVIGCKLIGQSVKRTRTDYEIDRGTCFSCTRCIDYCPKSLSEGIGRN